MTRGNIQSELPESQVGQPSGLDFLQVIIIETSQPGLDKALGGVLALPLHPAPLALFFCVLEHIQLRQSYLEFASTGKKALHLKRREKQNFCSKSFLSILSEEAGQSKGGRQAPSKRKCSSLGTRRAVKLSGQTHNK